MEAKASYKDLEEKIKLLELRLEVADMISRQNDVTNAFLKTLFDTIPSPIFYKDTNGIYQQCNDSFANNILGIKKEEIEGKSLFDLSKYIPSQNAIIYKEQDDELFNNPGVQVYDTKVMCKDGIQRDYTFYKATYSLHGKVLGLIGIMLDVSKHKVAQEELVLKNKKLNNLISIDWLTDLFNRRYFDEIFENKIKQLKENNISFSFAILDIDFFKSLNDSFGHDKGDFTLKELSLCMKNIFCEEHEYVFRLGGEEFGILFENCKKDKINKLKENISLLKIPSGNTVYEFLTVSIGLLHINNAKDIVSSSSLYSQADKLLYKAKKEGRNKIIFNNI